MSQTTAVATDPREGRKWAAIPVVSAGGFGVGYAYYDLPGYTPTSYNFDTYEEALGCADAINRARGLDPALVASIACSSLSRRR